MSQAHNIYHASLEEEIRKRQRKALDKEFGKRIATAGIAISLANIWNSQMIIWGLGFFKVPAGIWGVWFMLEAFAAVLAGSVALGMMRAIRHIQKIGN